MENVDFNVNQMENDNIYRKVQSSAGAKHTRGSAGIYWKVCNGGICRAAESKLDMKSIYNENKSEKNNYPWSKYDTLF